MAIKHKGSSKLYTTRDARDSRRRAQNIRRILVSILIIAVVLGTIFFLVLRREGTGISLAENGIGSMLTPIQNAVTTVTRHIKEFITDWRDYDALQDEYDALYQENLQQSLELDAAEEALMENERLKELLNAQSSYESLSPVYAKVIARDPGQWFYTFSINRGEAHGISTGMAVVNEDGLVGRIYECGLNYAKVLSIIDSRSGLSCIVQRTRDNCIMRGGVADTDDEALCSVNYLPNLNNIVPGDIVVTSGTDELYPKGITIGTITQISLDAGSQGNYAIVKPAVDFLHIEEVLVLRDVAETDDTIEALPSLITPTPAPSATPGPTPDARATLDPSATEGTFIYPTVSSKGQENAGSHLESLPEDLWAES
ncbi:MAG: rod shape-determining protein MreC [Christensenellales bacterium]|nr:rod shape-determining protein MreC [Christensenellales bacterium]